MLTEIMRLNHASLGCSQNNTRISYFNPHFFTEVPSNLSDLSTEISVTFDFASVVESPSPGPGQQELRQALYESILPGASPPAAVGTSLPRSSRMTWRTSCMLLCGAWLCNTFSVLVYSSGSR